MSSLPVLNYLSNAARTEGEEKVAFEDQLAAIKQIPGAGSAEATLTISGGSVTPPGGGPGIFAIDTESAAAFDDLTNIIQTNFPDGSILEVHPANAARVTTVKHNVGGAGTIILRNGADCSLGDITHWLRLKRSGTTWVELSRSPREGAVGISGKTGPYTVMDGDRGKVINCTENTFTVTLLPAARGGVGFDLWIRNAGTGIITLDGNASETIDGATTFKVQPGHLVQVICDGANWLSTSRHAPSILRGHLWGLTLSNNGADATNDVDIAVGEAAADTAMTADRVLLALSSALTKRLDATWVAGTNQGGRASSQSIADGTWHVFVMRVAGVDDVGFDTSVTGANLVTDHAATAVRRIGSLLRESAALVAFVQDGDVFRRSSSVLDTNNVSNPGDSLRSHAIPTGLRVGVLVRAGLATGNTGTPSSCNITDPSATNEQPPTDFSTTISRAATIAYVLNAAGSTLAVAHDVPPVLCNTSRQLRYNVNLSDANVFLTVRTLGWIDTRGRMN